MAQQSKTSPAHLQGCQSKTQLSSSLIRSYHWKSERFFGKPSHFVWENASVKGERLFGKPQLTSTAKPHFKHRSRQPPPPVPAVPKADLEELQVCASATRGTRSFATALTALAEPAVPAKVQSNSKGGLIRPLLPQALQPIKCSVLRVQLKLCVPPTAWQRDKQDKAPGALQTTTVK